MPAQRAVLRLLAAILVAGTGPTAGGFASFLRLTWQGMPVVAQPYCQECPYSIGVHPPYDCTASGAVAGHWMHSNLVFAESGQCPARPGHPSVLKRCFQSLLVNFALNVTILYSEVADCEASGSTGSAP